MEKKLRIQLYSNEGVLIDDRLVSQDTELYKGPKGVHDGPLRIEFTIQSEEDLDGVKAYLDKLKGKIPLETKVKKIKTKVLPFDENKQKDFLNQIKESGDILDQDQLISFLRKNNFVFVTTDLLNMMELGINIKSIHKDKQWMIRLLKRAKNPKNDKYDPMLLFGITLVGERDERIPIYLDKEFHDKIKLAIPEKPRETVKKTNLLVFPPFMELDEREKFRIELRKLEEDKSREPSKFFSRWAKYVENLPDLTREEQK